MTKQSGDFWVDVGGTFTDAIYRDPSGSITQTKVLSSGRIPTDAPENTQALRSRNLVAPVLAAHLATSTVAGESLPPMRVRMGTTRGTNALLTRQGADVVLVTNVGHTDVLRIGDQTRDQLFSLDIGRPPPLTENVVGIDGRLDHQGAELQPLNQRQIFELLTEQYDRGYRSIAITLIHATASDRHENEVQRIASEIGFEFISRSSHVSPAIGFTARAQTTVLDAYLNPILRRYIGQVREQFGVGLQQLDIMTSGGVLVDYSQFRGCDSILSGPAGGVIALQRIAGDSVGGAIGLDMGGTSTDVSYLAPIDGQQNGGVGRRFKTRVAGIDVLTPMMDIETIASGGGSICRFEHSRLLVGPASAGAAPGPACYGQGGPLTITDVNLCLGRLAEDRFAFQLDKSAAQIKIDAMALSLKRSPEIVAEGFLDIAIAQMAEAVRTVSTARGLEVRQTTLVGFGGAAGGHVCRVARILGIERIIDHPRGGILSAWGMGLAAKGHIATSSVGILLANWTMQQCDDLIAKLSQQCLEKLSSSAEKSFVHRAEIDLRYAGTQSVLAVESEQDLASTFHRRHQQLFGFSDGDREIEVVAVRVHFESRVSQAGFIQSSAVTSLPAASESTQRIFFDGQWFETQRFEREQIAAHQRIVGPAIVVSDFATLLIEPSWQAVMGADRTIEITPLMMQRGSECMNETPQIDDLKAGRERSLAKNLADNLAGVEVLARRLGGIADSMGESLRRTAQSVNVRDRRDYSCGVFDTDGVLVAGALHVPVHLGAMGHTIAAMRDDLGDPCPGDVWISNDPYRGGSHLPDVTVVMPVFLDGPSKSSRDQSASMYVAARAHHSEIGGITPGSMPPHAVCLGDEGVIIPPMILVRDKKPRFEELYRLLTTGENPSRSPTQNVADVQAQLAACAGGGKLLQQLALQYGVDHLSVAIKRLLTIAGDGAADWIASLPADREFGASDKLDDGHQIAVSIRRIGDRLRIAMQTDGIHPGPFNAPPAITTAAVLYVIKCMCPGDLPLSGGILEKIDIVIPPGILNPLPIDALEQSHRPAVVAGNVETSNRVVDVLLRAIAGVQVQPPAADSGGTMNNVIFGNETFGYYETLGNGSGATSNRDGADAIQTHMTNTAMTDVEVAERQLPVRIVEMSIRADSGGSGRYRGGNGIVRQYEFLSPVTVSLITSRRNTPPRGIAGGGDGRIGENIRMTKSGQRLELPSTVTYSASAGERLLIRTPGGGGWGEVAGTSD